MSGRRGFLKGLVGWVCGWSGAWRTAVGTGGCSLGTLCHGHPTALPTEELPRKEGPDTTALGPGLEPPGAVSAAKPTGTLKRPTSLSRHASAAGFPLSGASAWTLGRGHRSPLSAASPAEPLAEGPSPDATEDVSHLLADVACFAEGLEKLKECVLRDDLLEARRPLAQECVSEAIRVMRQVIAKYPLLSTVETLAAACNLMAKVKAFHYESNNESDKQEFEKALETIAVTFSSSVSELLLGEVDSSTLLSVPPGDPCQSMENLYEQGSESASASTTEDWESSLPPPEEVDMLLQRCEGGVEAALQYSKNMAKYMKDLIGYLDKRAVLEMDFAKGLQKIVQNCRQSITQEPHMPLLSIYSLALEQDLDFGHGLMQAVSTLQTQTFIQPLNQRRLEHEKRRKEIKDMWQRAQRKLQEAESNLRKAKQGYVQRCEDHDKARSLVAKAEEEQASSAPGAGGTVSKALDKRRRLEEEAKNKAEEAMATYRTCVADAKTQKQELEDTKVTVLRQIQEVIRQSDQTIKSVTISYYQMMQVQTAPLPVHFQMLCESSKLYDPGHQYASHVRQLQRGEEPYVHYDFEPHIPTNAWSPVMQVRKGSFSGGDTVGAEAAGTPPEEGVLAKEPRSGRGHKVHKSWPTSVSDPESGLDPNTGSAGDFKKYERTSSSGTMSSSEELTEQEGGTGAATFEQEDLSPMAPELPVAVPSGPFRHVGLSKAARTHRLRKLRTPAKCRECNSYVYFQGAECEECCLACHKKCLETLAIQCGHKKLQGRLQLFGQDFSQAARSTPDGVPFIIKKCIGEIEKRALHTKGIYRVNGVKTRVEKLCQAFETGKELVELSQAPPHDISNVLKLYLRQLPEPLISFRFYHELVGLAKDSLKAEAEIKAASRGRPDVAESEAAAVAMASRLRELLRDLPYENRTTLKYLLCHLRKIVEVEQDNKMTPGNLGIVFGPTLLRPRPTEATVSLSSLVDYPHQARIVETLIAHYGLVFEEEPEEVPGVPMREDGPANQRAEVVVQVSYSESGEEAEDAAQESHVAFNDSDSELDETPDPLDSSVDSALQHLSFLEARAGPEVENNEGPLGDQGAEAGAERELWDGISGYNSNQSNNKQLSARLPTVRVRRGRVAVAGGLDREPQFV